MKDYSLQTQAYQAIRKKIIYCELVPGKKISEKNLEELLHIGRTPIREALLQLKKQGLVDTIPQSGTYVSKIDLESASNARFVREQLERKIMVECCAKLTDSNLKILKTILKEQEVAIQNFDHQQFFFTDNLFHEACFEIAGRKEIWDWIDDYNTHLERYRWLRVSTIGLKWDTLMQQHYQLLEALASKNTEEVDFLTAAHLHLMLNEQDAVIKNFPDYFEIPADS